MLVAVTPRRQGSRCRVGNRISRKPRRRRAMTELKVAAAGEDNGGDGQSRKEEDWWEVARAASRGESWTMGWAMGPLRSTMVAEAGCSAGRRAVACLVPYVIAGMGRGRRGEADPAGFILDPC